MYHGSMKPKSAPKKKKKKPTAKGRGTGSRR